MSFELEYPVIDPAYFNLYLTLLLGIQPDSAMKVVKVDHALRLHPEILLYKLNLWVLFLL